MALAGPFLLARPDLSKTEVVKEYVYTIVAPAIDYWKETMEDKKGAQLARMKALCIFNPLHVLGNKISVSDIEGLKIFKLYRFRNRLKCHLLQSIILSLSLTSVNGIDYHCHLLQHMESPQWPNPTSSFGS
jgi:hypothetical protein